MATAGRRTGATALGLAGLLAAILPMAWFALFLAGLVPGSVDAGTGAAPGTDAGAIGLDLVLLLSFAIVHSLLARPAAKRLVTRRVPPALERSLYSLLAGAQVVLLIVLWRPPGGPPLWTVEAAAGRALLWAGQAAGWLLVLASLAAMDAAHLFGWRQARAWARGEPAPAPPLVRRGPYRFVRHPLYSGTLLALWSAPEMGRGRLLLAVVWTLYLLVGYRLEERDLAREHGAGWLEYRREVPPLLPRPPGLTGRRVRP
jgi:protein-S-isoprenylcysteine O-methyltransferase Ste14